MKRFLLLAVALSVGLPFDGAVNLAAVNRRCPPTLRKWPETIAIACFINCWTSKKTSACCASSKREHSDVKDLVKKIATTSGAGSKLLEEFAKSDTSINLDAIRLPPGELATRDAIASTKKNELLSQTGDKFELTLLLTQTEALNYAWHLAEIASQTDSQPERARALTGVGNEMKNLYHEVFLLLLSLKNRIVAHRTRWSF